MSSARAVPAVVLARRPEGEPRPEDFELSTTTLLPVAPGTLHLRTLDLSLDPYLRSLLGTGHLDDGALPIGAVVPGRSVSEVLDAGDTGVPVGSLVLADTGWAAEAVVEAARATPVRVPDTVPASAALGALGMPGLTAYAAHVRHIQPGAGDTVVVTSATGGVGAVAGALARRAGARTVAIVGNEEKARLAIERLGYDDAVVRTDPAWIDHLHAACPDKIDGYLHMGDQPTLDGVAEHLALGARLSLIGVIDQSNGAEPTRIRVGALMAARAHAHGMVVYDHSDLREEHVAVVSDLIREGDLDLVEDRHHGLAQAPTAFTRMMSGLNTGKVVVEVSPHRSTSR